LLVHARAERGPQWDVGTQLCVNATPAVISFISIETDRRFHVDKGSHLYFDPTPLYGSNGDKDAERQQSSSAHNPERDRQESQPHGGILELHTPSRMPQEQAAQQYPFLAQQHGVDTPHTPHIQFGMPPTIQTTLSTPGHRPASIGPQFSQGQISMAAPYSGTPGQFLNHSGPGALMNGSGGTPMTMGMNGQMQPNLAMLNGASPTPQRTGQIHMNMQQTYPAAMYGR
jgi:hypothetical protein